MFVTVLGRPDEGRDALMDAGLAPPLEALAAWQRWRRARPRSDDPVAARWLPLIGWNLRDAAIDQASRDELQRARHGVWASNQRILAAAAPALASLTAAGIPMVLLKGAALLQTVYDVPGLRPIGDVDVLVPPDRVADVRRLLAGSGWTRLRLVSDRDLGFCHSLDLRKPPDGALDVHGYLLHECCWPTADRGLWARATTTGSGMRVLSPADQLLHICLHGIRWSPVHAGHWVADAVRVIEHSGIQLAWDVLLDEARARELGRQLSLALRVVVERGRVDVPARVIAALDQMGGGWLESLESRLKGRPVVSAGGLFVIWAGWRRTARHARTDGAEAPPWSRYLAAALGVESSGAVAARLARHAGARFLRLGWSSPTRGASSRERLGRPPASC